MSDRLLLEAIDFAALKHRHQRRKDADQMPYINHPIAVAKLLAVEGGIDDPEVLIAAVLHDVLEDTDTEPEEIEALFGPKVCELVLEVTDDKKLPKQRRKHLQIQHAATSSEQAKLVKLADKICNLRDMTENPPTGWDIDRKREYFDWAKSVVDQLAGVHPGLEQIFSEYYKNRP